MFLSKLQMILKKLTTAKAYYDRKDWDTFQKSQESYLKNICEYPVVKNKKGTLPKVSRLIILIFKCQIKNNLK